MKEFNLAAVITAKRREKGLTQDELADYIGVTKASVSKWETGHSYPDITFLPALAAYFDISVDQLIGYSPQMNKSDIVNLYNRLAADFAKKPFENVITECELITRKYYSCYPLLQYIVQLYLNHAPMAATPQRKMIILSSAIRLCERITENCKDSRVIRDTAGLHAYCCLAMEDGNTALKLLGEFPDNPGEGSLIAKAHQLTGNTEKAEEVLQVELYQNLMMTFHSLINILYNNLNRLDIAEAVYFRAEKLANLFNMKQLNPNNTGMLYALGAQMYQLGGTSEKAVELLSKYVDVCVHDFFPFKLHGDSFFTKIEGWLKKEPFPIPRNEATIKESMMKDVLQLPVFEPLQDNPEYIKVVKKLKDFIGGN
ncbi:MAG: helix-turn-helix domain-containing protein [Treponema sp.]|nr:helix-turn-helix domain-containing protein [Treponema sp.]